MTQRPAIHRATIDLCRLVHEHNASLQICMHYYNKRLLIKWIFLITAALISCKLVIIKGPIVPLHLSESHLWASPTQLLLQTLQFSCGLLGGTPKKKTNRLASGQRFECWVRSLGSFLLPGLRFPMLHRHGKYYISLGFSYTLTTSFIHCIIHSFICHIRDTHREGIQYLPESPQELGAALLKGSWDLPELHFWGTGFYPPTSLSKFSFCLYAGLRGSLGKSRALLDFSSPIHMVKTSV